MIQFVSNANTLEKVSLQLQWKHQFEFAGFYIAKEKGFYKKAGLKVDIKEYDDQINLSDDIVNHKSTYGTNYANLILERSLGKNIVLLSAILQSSPHILVSLKSSDIKGIEDFKNKSIMIDSNEAESAIFTSMLKTGGVTQNEMKMIQHSYNINDLISGKIDLLSCFSSNELFILDSKNIKYDIWDPREYGFDFYDIILFTSQKELDDNPARVEAFRTTSLKGWKYAFANIEETVDLILQKYNTQNKTRDALLYEAKVLKKLAFEGSDTLGHINKIKIKNIYGVYNLMGITNNEIDLNSFIYYKATEDINNKYKMNYELIQNILIVISVIVFLILYRYFILNKVNKTLEQRVKVEVHKSLLKDRLIGQKTKMAEMGEMLDSIAHQWKQPLNMINLMTSSLNIDFKDKQIDEKYIDNYQAKIMMQVSHMTTTLSEFRDFFRPNQDSKPFDINSMLEKVMILVKDEFIKEKIAIIINNKENFVLIGVENEFMHLVLNIINNSKDAFIQRDIKNRDITINILEERIEFIDNAGGIPEDIIKNIFEANFTTKANDNGTGIGLYLSSQITSKFNGNLSVENVNDGVKFSFQIKN